MDNISLGFEPQKHIDTSLQRYRETHQHKSTSYRLFELLLQSLHGPSTMQGDSAYRRLRARSGPGIFHFSLKGRILKLREQIRKQNSLLSLT